MTCPSFRRGAVLAGHTSGLMPCGCDPKIISHQSRRVHPTATPTQTQQCYSLHVSSLGRGCRYLTTASRNGRAPDRIRKRGKQPLSCYDIASDHNRGRFNRLIQPGGGCWIWQGGCDKNGYGVLSISIGFGKERKIKAH